MSFDVHTISDVDAARKLGFPVRTIRAVIDRGGLCLPERGANTRGDWGDIWEIAFGTKHENCYVKSGPEE